MRRTPFHVALATRSFSWLLLGATVAACNPDRVTAPRGTGSIEGLRPQFSGGSGFSDGASIGVPGDNGPPANGSVAAFPIFTAPKGHFVQIEVTGTVTATHTTNCNPPDGSTGTWDAFGYFNQLTVNFSTSPYIGGLPTNGQGSGTMTVNRGVGGSDVTFSASRSVIYGGCTGGPGLNLSGSQSIEWEVYPFFEVTASPAVVPAGDSITFNASSHWSTTSNFWKYRANDTTATPLGSGFPAVQVCSSSSTCKYAPSASGRMYRVGGFPAPDGGQYASPSPIVWVGTAPDIELQVTAFNAGTMTVDSIFNRGTEIELQVSNGGRGRELNGVGINWRFEPDSVKYYDNGVSGSFAPVVVYDNDADSTWRGKIVHPGKVIVEGVGPSNTDEDTLVIGVDERTWSPSTVLLDTAAYNAGQLNLVNQADSIAFGEFHSAPYGMDGSITLTNFFTFNGFSGLPVNDSGPNGPYWWIASLSSVRMHRAYSLNDWIDPPGQSSYAPGPLTTTGWLISQGDSLAMMNFRRDIIEHERRPIANSHLARHDSAAADAVSCGHVTMALERLVGDSAVLTDFFADAVVRASQAIAYASSHEFVFGHVGPDTALVADWVNIPNARTWLDTAMAVTPPTAPFCDFSGF